MVCFDRRLFEGRRVNIRQNRIWQGHLFALISVTAWGTSFLVSKSLMTILSPAQLMFLRFVMAYCALWVIYPKWHFHWREEGSFLLLSVVGNTLYFLAENTALKLTLASNVSILVSAAPIFTALLLLLLRQGERLSRRQAAGLAIAFLGVLFVVFNGVFILKLNPAGDLLALFAAFCWASYSFIAKRIREKADSFLITRKLMFYGILTTVPLLLAEGSSLSVVSLLGFRDICGLLYLGLICSAACYLIYTEAIAILGAMKTNLYVYAVPVVTLLASAVFLKERITAAGVAGMILVIGGMVLSSLEPPGKQTR